MILIVDATGICHTEKHAKKGLSYEKYPTGVIFGFFEAVFKLAKKFNTNRFVFTWDSRKSFREEIFPEYKATRKRQVEKTPEEVEYDLAAYRQFKKIRRELLPRLGFKNNYIQSGLEADDIMASLTRSNHEQFIIITDDKDLYQCVSNHCSVYRPRTKQTITYEKFKDEWGLEPEKWADMIAYAGCTSDEVPGIPGIGIKTAAKFLRGEIKGFGKVASRLVSPFGQALYERNIKLVKLPFENTPKFEVQDDGTFHLNRFVNLFEEFGFYSFLKYERIIEWRANLNLQ